mgnify:CR=1 FL=1
MYKVNDYEKEDFKRITNKDGLNTYFIKVNRIYIEVDKDIYLTCLRSYMKIKYNKEREVANSVQYYSDMDLATSFIFNRSKYVDFVRQIYIKDLAKKAVQEIYSLPNQYKNIAICIFLEEMTIAETSEKLHIPIYTVGKRKKKIQKILKNKLKDGEKNF